jgi:hypothetical protein
MAGLFDGELGRLVKASNGGSEPIAAPAVELQPKPKKATKKATKKAPNGETHPLAQAVIDALQKRYRNARAEQAGKAHTRFGAVGLYVDATNPKTGENVYIAVNGVPESGEGNAQHLPDLSTAESSIQIAMAGEASRAAKAWAQKTGKADREIVEFDGAARPRRDALDPARLEKPWLLTESQYQAISKVKQPWAGEISAVQYQRLSKRGQKEYDEKRRREWAASADIKEEWAQRVGEAFEAGEFTLETPGVTKEAKTAIRRGELRRKEEEKASRFDDARKANQVTIETVEVGDRVHDVLYRKYGTVAKKFKKSVRLEDGSGDQWKAPLGRLERLSYNDLKAAVEAGDFPPEPELVPLPPAEAPDEPSRDEMRRSVLVYDADGDVIDTQEIVIRRGELARKWMEPGGWTEPRRVSGISHKRNAIALGPKGKYDLWLSPQEVCPESFFQDNPGCSVRPPEVAPEAPKAKKKAKKKATKKAKKKATKKAKKKATKKKATKKKATKKAPARSRGRAREQWLDPITGQPVPAQSPGAVPSGAFVARARARKGAPLQTVEIERQELGPASYRIELTADELAVRARLQAEELRKERALETKLAKLKGKQAIPGIRETYRSASAAARDFLVLNEFYYAPVVDGVIDFYDAAREWADGQEVWVPRKGRSRGSGRDAGYNERLSKTTKGRKLLETPGQTGLLAAVLTWIFSQTASKRWDDVDWHRIESLNDQIDDAIETQDAGHAARGARSGHESLLFPAASGVYEGDELARHPEVQALPRARATVEGRLNVEALIEAKDQLEAAYKVAKPCLAPDVRRVIAKRLRYLRHLERNPIRIEAASICAHARATVSGDLVAALEAGGGSIEDRSLSCTFPLLIEDTKRLTRTCEEGYSPDWPADEVGRWGEDPERFESHLEATPEPLRARAYRAPVPSSIDGALEAFDAKEAEMFGPPVDEEIPF